MHLTGKELSRAVPLLVDVSVLESSTGGYEATLSFAGASGSSQRTVTLASCAEVERAVPLLITTAMQLEGANAELPAEPEPEPPPPPPPRVVQCEPPPVPVVPSKWWLLVSATGDLAALPGASAGPALGLGVHLGSVRLSLEARHFAARERTQRVSGLPAEVGLSTAALGGGYVWTLGRVSFGPRAELELGALRARVLGERALRTARALWAAAMIGGQVGLAVRDGVHASLSADVALPLARPGFVLVEEPVLLPAAEEPPLHRVPVLTPRLTLALRIRLGA